MRKIIVVSCVMLLFFSGCTLFQRQATEETMPSKQDGINQAFYGFPDIPVPKELNFVKDKSFVYETTNLRAGVMYLSGNVDLQSLENYFKINMIKNGWRFVNSFKFRDVALNFMKDDRSCNIKMSRETFNSEVEIWVGPTPSEKMGMPRGTELR